MGNLLCILLLAVHGIMDNLSTLHNFNAQESQRCAESSVTGSIVSQVSRTISRIYSARELIALAPCVDLRPEDVLILVVLDGGLPRCCCDPGKETVEPIHFYRSRKGFSDALRRRRLGLPTVACRQGAYGFCYGQHAFTSERTPIKLFSSRFASF